MTRHERKEGPECHFSSTPLLLGLGILQLLDRKAFYRKKKADMFQWLQEDKQPRISISAP